MKNEKKIGIIFCNFFVLYYLVLKCTGRNTVMKSKFESENKPPCKNRARLYKHRLITGCLIHFTKSGYEFLVKLLRTLIRINLVPFIASSKEQCWAGLEISFFTLTFRVPAAETKHIENFLTLNQQTSQKNTKQTKTIPYSLKKFRFFETHTNLCTVYCDTDK